MPYQSLGITSLSSLAFDVPRCLLFASIISQGLIHAVPCLCVHYTPCLFSIQVKKPGSDSETSSAMGGARKGRRVSLCTTRGVKGRIDAALVFRDSGSELVRERKVVAVAMGTNHTAMLTGK